MSAGAEHSSLDRRARQRADTRARLLGAAQTLFARQGIDATRINEITETADVGFGSFYNYFDSKDAIVAAVMEQAAAAAGAAIDAATADIEDPAEVVAVAHRTLLQIAIDDPELGWLMVRLEISHDLASTAFGAYAARDLTRGLESGRFSVVDAEAALAASGGALLAVIRGLLNGQFGSDVVSKHAATVLRLVGLGLVDALEVAHRPLPQVPLVEPTGRRTTTR